MRKTSVLIIEAQMKDKQFSIIFFATDQHRDDDHLCIAGYPANTYRINI